jgi:uncharacterized protein (UPF0371 family)
MGVNMVGFAISNDDVASKASKDEIIRRYLKMQCELRNGKVNEESLDKIAFLMRQLNISISDRKCIDKALKKAEETGTVSMAMELEDGTLISAKTSDLLTAPAALLLNALKRLAKIDDSLPLLSKNVIEPIQKLKTSDLNNHNPRLHAEEVLIALAIQATTNAISEIALNQLYKLKGCQAHSSIILPESDLNTFKKLGIDVTEEPVSYAKKLYIK